MTNASAHVEDDDTIDLQQLFQNLLSHWRWILTSIVLCLLVAIFYLRVAKPEYQANALLQVQSDKNASSAILGDLANVLPTASQAQTEVEILKSRVVVGAVIKNLHLDISLGSDQDRLVKRLIRNQPSQLTYGKTGVSYTAGEANLSIGDLVVPDWLLDQNLTLTSPDGSNFTLTHNNLVLLKGRVGTVAQAEIQGKPIQIAIKQLAPNYKYYINKMSLLTASSAIGTRLTVAEKGKMTGILSLTYQDKEKQLVTDVLNEILSIYAQRNVTQKSTETDLTLNFLNKQLPELKAQLEAAELKFNQFRRANKTIDVSKEAELLLAQQAKYNDTKLELEQKRAELSTRYTNEYPVVAEINAQLASLEAENAQVTGRLNQLPEVQRQYLQLSRDVEVNTGLYTNLLNNYQQLKIVRASQIGNVRVIDTAITPLKPIKPKKSMILVLSILAGGLLGVGSVLLKGFFYSGIRDSSQLESGFGIPIMATVPRSKSEQSLSNPFRRKQRPLLVLTDSEDMAVESLRSLRTVVHFAAAKTNNIIMISGASPRIGKSFISANFGGVLAQAGKKVLLIDGDMRRGHLHDYFEMSRDNGLSEYITQPQISLESICKPTVIDNFYFMTTGTIPLNPAELLLTERFNNMMRTLSSQFDYVIIDTPPVLAATDALIIGKHAGINLMVARYGLTHLKEIELSLSRLDQAGLKVNGFIFNDIQQENIGSYVYQYGYEYRSAKS